VSPASRGSSGSVPLIGTIAATLERNELQSRDLAFAAATKLRALETREAQAAAVPLFEQRNQCAGIDKE
jgi:hypothetical protein